MATSTGSATGAGPATGTDNAFNPKVVLALLLFGGIAFFAMLYFIGSGQTGNEQQNSRQSARAHSNSLDGYSALVGLLKNNDFEIRSRLADPSDSALDDEPQLLIITPPRYLDPDAFEKMIDARRFNGPTMIILPKWNSYRIKKGTGSNKGWVHLNSMNQPAWTGELAGGLEIVQKDKGTRWSGLGLSGSLPQPKQSLGLISGKIVPLVKAENSATLVGYLDDNGNYPALDEVSGYAPKNSDALNDNQWNVTYAIDADLFNNYGMSGRARARLALSVIETVMEGDRMPIVFTTRTTAKPIQNDKNLLTLAFTVPFIAATLCLIAAMIIIAWRAFRRFGPPIAEQPPIALGKARLVENSARFVLRSRRLYLLTIPYVQIMRQRLSHRLGLRSRDPAATDAAIDAALAQKQANPALFTSRSQALLSATRRSAILRAAADLKSIERMLQQ